MLGLQTDDILLTAGFGSQFGSGLTIHSKADDKAQWPLSLRQIEVLNADSLYYCKITYPSSNVIGYYVYVHQHEGPADP